MPNSVNYSVVERKNPSKKDAPMKFYAQAQSSGDVDTDEMARRIEKSCTVTRADVAAVLTALEDTIVEGLQKGEIVRLGNLGNFQIGLSSKGADTAKEFSVSMIQSAKINFRAGSALRDVVHGLSYSRVRTIQAQKETGQKEDPTLPVDPVDPTNPGGEDVDDPNG